MPQIIVLSFATLLFFLIHKPILLVYAYFFGRPIVQEFGIQGLTLFSLPINWPIAVIIIVSAFPFGVLMKRFNYFPKNSGTIYLLVFLSIISALESINITATLSQTIKYLNALALVLVAVNAVKTEKDIMRIFQGIFLSSVIPMLYGYYQYFLGLKSWTGADLRMVSFFGFPNMYGIYLSLIIFIGCILYFEATDKKLKRIYIVILISAISSTILGLNRGSWIAIIAGILFAFPFYKKHLNVKWFIIVFSIIGVVASGIIIQRFMELQEVRVGADTLTGRLSMWGIILAEYSKVPLFGFGAGTVHQVMIDLFYIDNPPHNDYLRIFLELGYFGPIVFMIMLLNEIRWNFRVRKYQEVWYINYFSLVMIIYMATISTVQNVIHNVVVFPIFLVVCHLARKYVIFHYKK